MCVCEGEREVWGRPCVWSALKRMHRFFRDGERWNSSTIAVYSGPITLSLCIILYSRSYHELTTCARSNGVHHSLWSEEKTTLGPEQITEPYFHDNSWFSGWICQRHTHTRTETFLSWASLWVGQHHVFLLRRVHIWFLSVPLHILASLSHRALTRACWWSHIKYTWFYKVSLQSI